MWTENILKTELFENDDISLVTSFPCPSFVQTQIQNGRWLMCRQISPALCGRKTWYIFRVNTSFSNLSEKEAHWFSVLVRFGVRTFDLPHSQSFYLSKPDGKSWNVWIMTDMWNCRSNVTKIPALLLLVVSMGDPSLVLTRPPSFVFLPASFHKRVLQHFQLFLCQRL